MMSLRSGHLRWQAVLTGLTAWLLGSCQPSVPVWGPAYPDIEGHGSTCDGCGGKKPKKELTICDIAHEIDELEEHIEKYGSVVPKHADVWGQARLTMHRQEFERVMRADTYNFQPSIQATISASDQAFLANALSLSAGAKTANSPTATDAMSLLASPNDAITRNQLVSRNTISNYVTPQGKLALEPTLLEDQKKRYLDHLHQLRRINEGDDNTDAPGYALNLVRIPVSLLTGSCTQTGYGAECTITATSHFPDDLLPQTFRNLVVNDLVKLLTLPLTRIIEREPEEELQRELDAYEKARKEAIDAQVEVTKAQEQVSAANERWTRQADTMTEDQKKQLIASISNLQNKQDAAQQKANNKNIEARSAEEHANDLLYGFLAKIIAKGTPVSPHRINQVPIATSQLVPIIGALNLAYLTQHVRRQIKDHLACTNAVYHLDVQAVLASELGAAFEFLSSEKTQLLWRHCTPILTEAIRTQDIVTLIRIQKEFFHSDIENLSDTKYITGATGKLPITRTMTSILAWTIIIDSALLNQRFLEEMRATHAAKGCPCAPPEWALLFLPHPPPDVCQLFNDFVRCRWPLHIFALDPETEDQNVGDSFSLRRELQLAMSVAFTSGLMSANNFTRYVRRIEQDIDTISINRTIIGFSHGDDTFGWRFYPRVQTPPIDGNFQAFFRDLLIGGYGPRYSLRRRRLENGIRECVALIIMPSFVPYLDLEVTGNWFRLANPKCKALDLKQTMRLSATVKSLQDLPPQTCDQHCYRPGDIELMMRRLDQLSQRLPLQRQLVNVPSENTHGGFEVLSPGGITNLAPELNGWYGAPGIYPYGETSIYLVGDNFSVDQTRVIVGGMLLDPNCPTACSTARDPATCICTAAPTAPASKATTPAMPAGTSLAAPPGPPSLLPVSRPVSLAPQKNEATSLSDSEVDSEVQQAIFRRCRPQEARPAAAPVVTLFNAPNGGMLPGMQAAAAGAQAATASAQAALAGVHAALANGGLGSGAVGGIPALAGVVRAGGAADAITPAAAAQPAAPTPAGAAANAAANIGVTAAQTATAGAQTVAKTEQTIAATSTALSLAYDVPHFQMELLSRQVMRIVIPRGVYSNNGCVDVHIATPYGVSPHLAIPILGDTTVAAPSYGYSVDENSKVTINYTLLPKSLNQANPAYDVAFVGNGNKDAVIIDWSSPTGSILNQAKAVFQFAFQGQDLKYITTDPVTAHNSEDEGGNVKPKTSGGYFRVSSKDLEALSRYLVNQLKIDKDSKVISFGGGDTLPSSLTTKSITIQLLDGTSHVTQAVPTANQLTVQFKLVPPSGELVPDKGKVILPAQKQDNKLIFSPGQVSQLKEKISIHVPGIDKNESLTIRIRLKDLPENAAIDAELEQVPNRPSYYRVKDENKLAGDFKRLIDAQYGDQMKQLPQAIPTTSLTIIFMKGPLSKLNELSLAGSLTIKPE